MTPLADSPSDQSELETTAENLARFLYDQRTNWPGAVLDSVSFAKELREPPCGPPGPRRVIEQIVEREL